MDGDGTLFKCTRQDRETDGGGLERKAICCDSSAGAKSRRESADGDVDAWIHGQQEWSVGATDGG